MKKLLLLSALLTFTCSSGDSSDVSNLNLIEFLKGKVYQKETPNGVRYVHFDLSFLGEDTISERYEGWIYYEKYNDDPNQLGCFLDYGISSSDYGLYLQWYTDTIINNPTQFKLEGIYGQSWIVTKDDADMIGINSNGSNIDYGYTEMSLEDFMALDCI
ncbi:hypothetical protein N9H82_05975 [Flavobacteriaceae bacterium]|nr:hypothetical protein [Flavobacteriaceae bacterium]